MIGSSHDWVESSLDLKHDSSRAFLGVTISQKTRIVSLACVLSVLGLFFLRAVELQIVEGSGFAGLSTKNTIREYRMPAKRGTFFDRNGRRLVSNTANFIVLLYPTELPSGQEEKKTFIDALSKALGLSSNTISEEISDSLSLRGPIILKEHITRDDALLLSTALNEFEGIELAVEEVRNYEFGNALSLSHIIGYTGRITKEEYEENSQAYYVNDMIGKDGLEAKYESALRGVFGIRKVETDARGEELGVVAQDPAYDGNNIVLTIDYDIQKNAEETLTAVLKKFGKKKGAVIVSQPRTGEILAMVSLPSYNNNQFSFGISRQNYASLINDPDLPLFPRASRGEYPSGSTIKMIIAAAALQERIITPTTQVLSSGGIRIGEWFFPDWKSGGHGLTNLSKALSESVNTYFYMIGGGYKSFTGLGIEKIVKYLREMGLGSKTGIDLPNEKEGFVPDSEWKKNEKHEVWYIGDTYHVSIGQGDIIVTPLQVHAYTSYFANNGASYTPHLVKEIMKSEGIEGSSISPTPYRAGVFRPDVIEEIRLGLRQGVISGSSKRLSLLPISAAGKTGTAQWHTDRAPHAWFTGWAPFDDPQVAITVLIEEGEEGSRSAVMVAYELLKTLTEQKKLVY
ncbi:penicillin-binding protein 2 [Candidatus Uhrbacteria bacterium]|nr:penicillin-binding protein 2 [Candidatus Uhrbacteria bacterium]